MRLDDRTPPALEAGPADAYRAILERYDVNGLVPDERLPDRERAIEGLVRDLRPLLDAIVDADAANAEVQQLEQTLREHADGPIAQVARGRLLRANDRRDLAFGRVRELIREERTLLRYVLLRQLVRSTPR
jgi:hypothetical protein